MKFYLGEREEYRDSGPWREVTVNKLPNNSKGNMIFFRGQECIMGDVVKCRGHFIRGTDMADIIQHFKDGGYLVSLVQAEVEEENG